jgi:hypothetical protein
VNAKYKHAIPRLKPDGKERNIIMAAQWGNNSLAPGKSAGFSFVMPKETGFLPVLQVMPLSPSDTDADWFLTSGGYPALTELGISTIWSQLTNDVIPNVMYFMVVQNNSNSVVEYAFLEANL